MQPDVHPTFMPQPLLSVVWKTWEEFSHGIFNPTPVLALVSRD